MQQFITTILFLTVFTTAFSQSPNYSNLTHWAAHPAMADNADRVPKDLQKTIIKDSLVDVFFLHPTTSFGSKGGWNASLTDSVVNKRTDERPMLYQATIFNEKALVYAPRYRQAHYKAYFTSDKDSAQMAFDLAYEDVKNAFIAYLDNWNKGRPFIIAAHSQGTQHGQRLIKELIEGSALQDRMVMAYLLGMPIREQDFEKIKPCTDSTQTGCFVSWRTLRKGFEGEEYIRLETKDVVVTNPLTWKTDSVYAPAHLNRGGILYNFDKVRPGLTDAQKQGNVLWARRPKVAGSFLMRLKNYHIGDYNLFYLNVREDVARRIRYFLSAP